MSYKIHIPRIAITPGEPAGIGPDIVAKLKYGVVNAELVLIADQILLHTRAKQLGIQWIPEIYNNIDAPQSGRVRVWHVPLKTWAYPGKLNPDNVNYVLHTLEIACDGCLNNIFDAVVTGPVHKGIINQSGHIFTGHTEWFANRCGGEPVMLLMTEGLKVALVTTHIPLAQVSAAITPARLTQVLRILYKDLSQRFGIVKPQILVCGLNPHAGEGGYLGQEEQLIIEPVLKNLRAEGMNLIGPLSADTIFIPKQLHRADAVLAMYHDQGLPVLKHMGFAKAANVTLGLPIIRVSVDHGTALDIAGTGEAQTGSLEYALHIALEMCKYYKHFSKKL